MGKMREQIMASMGPAMRCALFDTSIFDVSHFDTTQTQIEVELGDAPVGYNWLKKEIKYTCSFDKQSDYDNTKPTAIIPIRDCSNIITMCMESMKRTDTFDMINVIIVDDRSTEDIEIVAKKYGVSYLRVDYDSTFNFSMLCNIAAKICSDLGNTQVIMWNADLFISDRKNLETIISKHNKYDSKISGAKLLYPPIEYSTSSEHDTTNILTHFPRMVGKWRNTVQFGGSQFIPTPGNPIDLSPIHKHRFEQKEEASYDAQSDFVTGAFQLMDLGNFMSVGGYNPSLENNFQDVDICKGTDSVWYFGDDVEFYHDESPVMGVHKTKFSKQMQSDHILYGLLWNQ
tara:strand:+ start:279 stop:1307 length:1029 start_codon:yes stop_codon:yes gene_type:complete